MGYVGFTVKVKRSKAILAAILILSALLLLADGLLVNWAVGKVKDNADLIADVLIAEIAHLNAGGIVPVDGIDYTWETTEPVWGVESNSKWLSNYMDRIVPLLVFEKISVDKGVYPVLLGFFSYDGVRAYTVLGTTYPASPFSLTPSVVIVNERLITDPSQQDAREIVGTLTHELIHAQGGDFSHRMEEIVMKDWKNASIRLESLTSAATVEALAALCNTGDEIACGSFWMHIEYMARNDLRAHLFSEGKDDLYLKLASILWMDEKDEAWSYKYARFWLDSPEERENILWKYQVKPWREMVIPGVLVAHHINTGMVVGYQGSGSAEISRVYQGMPFDDTKFLLPFIVEYLMRYIMFGL